MTDITKKNTSLVSLYTTNEEFIDFFERLNFGIAIHHADGSFAYTNSAYKKMVGWESDEHIGKAVKEYFSTAEQGVLAVLEEKQAMLGKTVTHEGVHGLCYRTPLINSGGELEGCLVELISAGFDRDTVAQLMKAILDLEKKSEYYEWKSRNQPGVLHTFDSVIGESAVMRQMKTAGQRFAKGTLPILVSGESGTGKELVAQSLHTASSRAQGPFIAVNCAALPPELMESELFGYNAGAFSGSRRDGMKGKFELADKGTIFLDEIGDLPLSMQSKLLRVLESGEIQKIGQSEALYIDFRLIAATNRDLESLVASGDFREDLFHRLNVLELSVPPLRDRLDDIQLLAICMLEQIVGFRRAHELCIDNAVHKLFRSYSWPGNIRELKNVISFALYAMDENEFVIEVSHLPKRFVKAAKNSRSTTSSDSDIYSGGLSLATESAERTAILAALERASYNKSKAADDLGISRSKLYKKMRALGLMN